MRVLIIHNSYFSRGGEDEVVQAEKRMLEAYGHTVFMHNRSNREFKDFSAKEKVCFFLKDIFWSRDSYEEIRTIIRRENPDIAHIHNVLFMISSSAYDACFDENVPVVQTLHNFRFLCPIGIFFRRGKICERCLSVGKKSAIFYRCWKNSYLKSFLLVQVVERLGQKVILQKKVHGFICLTRFSKNRFASLGISKERIFIKPNFLDKDPGAATEKDSYAIFVGALRDYKGIKTLIRAWSQIHKAPLLKVVGEGPLEVALKDLSKGLNVEFVGQRSFEETLYLIKNASFLILPSECYESFPRVIVEAYSCGVPVVVSQLASLEEIVEEGKTGIFFKPGDAKDLAQKITQLIQDPERIKSMGFHARKRFEEQYTIQQNLTYLEEIYKKVLQRASQSVVKKP